MRASGEALPRQIKRLPVLNQLNQMHPVGGKTIDRYTKGLQLRCLKKSGTF